MNLPLHKTFVVAMIAAFGLAPLATRAASQTDEPNTIPISTLVAAVAKRSGKKFIVDPRVKGDALLLQENPTALSYDDLLMVLNVHGFAAIATGDYVRVVPDPIARQIATPVATDDNHPAGEYVTRVLTAKSIPTSLLVPLLRPLIPQQGHLVALPCTNHLIIVDTFANTQRLEQVIKSMDRGEPYVPEKCKPGQTPPRVIKQESEKKDSDKKQEQR